MQIELCTCGRLAVCRVLAEKKDLRRKLETFMERVDSGTYISDRWNQMDSTYMSSNGLASTNSSSPIYISKRYNTHHYNIELGCQYEHDIEEGESYD